MKNLLNDLRNIPDMPEHLRLLATEGGVYLGGRANYARQNVTVTISGEEYSFAVEAVTPNEAVSKRIIYIRKSEPLGADLPIEDIIGKGVELTVIDVDGIKSNKRLSIAVAKSTKRSKFKEAKLVAWCTERVVDYLVSTGDGGDICVVGSGEQYPAALAVGLYDDRVKEVVLAFTSQATSREAALLNECSESFGIIEAGSEIVVLETLWSTGESVFPTCLPEGGSVRHATVGEKHLGIAAWDIIT